MVEGTTINVSLIGAVTTQMCHDLTLKPVLGERARKIVGHQVVLRDLSSGPAKIEWDRIQTDPYLSC